jgi:protein-disulfide isomerase
MDKTKGGFLLLISMIALGATMAAQSATAIPAGAAEQGITRKQADEILNELRQIRQLLAAQPRQAAPAPQPAAQPQNAKLSIQGLSVLGRADAPLTVIEFSDYQCAFCRAFHTNTFEQIKKDWIDTGKIRFVSWDLPLDFHSNAMGAARAALCAGEQNKFWEMRSLLITNATKLEPDAILGYAKLLPQLDFEKFKACESSDRFQSEIKKSTEVANAQGISGTPTFVIGKSTGDIVDGQLFFGAQPYSAFESKLTELSK